MAIKDVKKIGSRGVILTFEDDISVYLIHAAKRWFLCDTHLGPQSMKYVKEYLSMEKNNKEVIVFNSHSDWDHIWGNCAFQGGIIIGHETCRKRMNEIGPFEMMKLSEFHCGNVELVLPNVTFSDRMAFVEDEIEFIYAPGHTIDSSLCFDKKDAVLFVGDLVEYPIPYLDFYDLTAYIKTLDFIKSFPARAKVSAHSGIIDDDLISRNSTYVRDIMEGNPIHLSVYQESLSVHNFNINNRLFLQYESMVRETLKENFDYSAFKSSFDDLKKVGYHDLQEALETYFSKITKSIL